MSGRRKGKVSSRHSWVRRTCAAFCTSLLIGVFGHVQAAGAEPIRLKVDFSQRRGEIRALHGINKGPLVAGGLIDLSREHRALRLPSIRLHDCHWPNPDVVDMHVLFPDPDANPALSESYNFASTDEYLAAARASGAEIVFRLGESIEHTKIRRHVHPPKDREQWAAAACGIIRHYNEGWAAGFQYGIRYWEIWNEPENRPAMWSGTDADYFQLYKAAARTIKTRFPDLKVGGPAVGAPGSFVGGAFQPSAFLIAFLSFCRRESLPLDFFSWHCYSANPREIVRRARAIRDLLNESGFARTESHLNEWNYLPDNKWEPVAAGALAPDRERHYARMAGAEGAAFIAATLSELQECPLDMANIFHGEVGGFGLFNEHGVPAPNYDAVLAFRTLLDTPQRVQASGGVPEKVAVIAGHNAEKSRLQILITNCASLTSGFQLELEGIPWRGPSLVEIRRVDEKHRFDRCDTRRIDDPRIDFSLPAPGLILMTLQPN